MEPDKIARVILTGFEAYRVKFREITVGAKDRFAIADWVAVQDASSSRIELYRVIFRAVASSVQQMLGEHDLLEGWARTKTVYSEMIEGRPDRELAETVFNTIFRKTFPGHELNDQYAFVRGWTPARSEVMGELVRYYGPSSNLPGLLQEVLLEPGFQTPFRDLEEDIQHIAGTMRSRIPLLRMNMLVEMEILKSVFYRNKGAYLVGRMMIDDHAFPIAIPLLNNGTALYVDTIIWNEADLSLIFSFTRSYFMVEQEHPNELVIFLQSLLPAKKRSELYASIGLYKHGKTEFYRGFLNHLEASDDSFVIAEGIKGLVMAVFTLPSYNVVFKVIKDKFSPSKNITREQVKSAYSLVKTHDRVGRMADTQEFAQFVFPRSRFSEELIQYLLSVAGSSISMDEDQVVISHLYSERLMTPLNLYIKGLTDYELIKVLDEYGNAVKQLAAANIFPGDMLLKNFGVTRHGRVVFYDYDEICYLTEVNFRKIPASRHPEDVMSAEPWYSVGPMDVFPEEFGGFLFITPKIKRIFLGLHGDLFEAQYWQNLQHNIREQLVLDVFPYRQQERFVTQF